MILHHVVISRLCMILCCGVPIAFLFFLQIFQSIYGDSLNLGVSRSPQSLMASVTKNGLPDGGTGLPELQRAYIQARERIWN